MSESYVGRGPSAVSIMGEMSAWKLLDVKDASSSATLDFTSGFTSDYEMIQFVLRGVVPSTNDAALICRLSNDGGATFLSGASDYEESLNVTQSSANTPTSRLISSFGVGQSCANNAAVGGTNGVFNLFGHALSGASKQITCHTSVRPSSVTDAMYISAGRLAVNTNAVNAVRFLFPSGTIVSGRILMYGLRNTQPSPQLQSYATGATQADQEAATSTDKYVAPATQKYHPAAAKAWVRFNMVGGVPTIKQAMNVASLTDLGVGLTQVNFTNAFSSGDYVAVCSFHADSNGRGAVDSQAAGSLRVLTRDNASTLIDGETSVIVFGDLP